MNMNEIVNALMIGSTVAVGLFVALGMLLGLLKGWKNGVLTLCRLAASLLIAFGITKLLFAIVSPEAIRDLLLSSIKDLLATVGFGSADGLASLAGVITASGAIPFVFTYIPSSNYCFIRHAVSITWAAQYSASSLVNWKPWFSPFRALMARL